MDVLRWVGEHYPELVGALGLGSGGGLVAKKLADRKQDRAIAGLKKKITSIDMDLVKVKNDIATNTLFDKQFRDQMRVDYKGIKEETSEIKARLETILTHLLNSKR
jgi:hypothetical protein